jgi:hypothetical protein
VEILKLRIADFQLLEQLCNHLGVFLSVFCNQFLKFNNDTST